MVSPLSTGSGTRRWTVWNRRSSRAILFVWCVHVTMSPTRPDVQHHQIAATQMLLYDINTVQAENKEALIGARKAVALIRHMPLLVRYLLDAL